MTTHHPDGRMIPVPGDEVVLEVVDHNGFRRVFHGKVQKPRRGAKHYTVKVSRIEGQSLLGEIDSTGKHKSQPLTADWSVVGDPVVEKSKQAAAAAKEAARQAREAALAPSMDAALAAGHTRIASWLDLSPGDRVAEHGEHGAIEFVVDTRIVHATDVVAVMGRDPKTTRFVCLPGWEGSPGAHRAFEAIKTRHFAAWPQNGDPW